MNYKRNRRYFFPINVASYTVPGALFLILAIVASVLGFAVFPDYSALGIAGAAIGGAGLIAICVYVAVAYCSKPSDAQIDAQYQSLADTAAQAALQKVGLDDELKLEIKPVVLSACIFEEITTPFRMTEGKDGKVRSSNFANFVLLFTLEQIITYRSEYSLIRQEWRESVEEYYYDDIVTLKTRTDVFSYGGGVIHREELEITTAAGTSLVLPFENNRAALDAIRLIRKILRAKKRFR